MDIKEFNNRIMKKFTYRGSRPKYRIHDKNPNILIVEVNPEQSSVLGINLNYVAKKTRKNILDNLDGLSAESMNFWQKILTGVCKIFGIKADFYNGEIFYRKLTEKYPRVREAVRKYKTFAMAE